MLRRTALLTTGILLGTTFCAARARADVKLHALFTDDMVLQRDQPIPVWGSADPGEAVTVAIGTDHASTVADENGKWQVRLHPLAASTRLALSVSGKNRIDLHNVAVGDVFLCSGQSNMQLTVNSALNAAQEVAQANYPDIRLFTVNDVALPAPVLELGPHNGWKVCSPETVGDFSAVAYYFGREMYQRLSVPIGLIHSSWGGTIAQAWTSRQTLETMPEYQPALAALDAAVAANHFDASQPNQPTVLYNAMIAPLIPFSLRGVIWYQGESNADDPAHYATLFPAMIQDWRTNFGRELPFYFVQLPNYMARVADPVQPGWADMREAQSQALELPHVGMAVTIDVGEGPSIHPKDKQSVGKRLALAMLQDEYDLKIEGSGPTFQRQIVEDGRIRVTFRHAEGLKTSDGTSPKAFAIADVSGHYVAANAMIDGNSVILSSPDIKHPTMVRYAWLNNPETNLYNSAGLPAVPFRTDK